MGRIQFNRTSELGVLYNGYENGMPITVPQGKTQTITVFNGKASGQVYFDVVVSHAAATMATSMGLAMLAYSLY